jgi:predicted MFS family arabinose efflux permease
VTDEEHRGWPVVIAYAAVCAGTQLLWLTYAPIDTGSARYYGVSSSAIGWLANVFPLLYVALAIPAGRLLDSRFRPTLAGAGALMAVGGLVRLGGQAFAWAMAGQLMIAVAQPFVLSAMGKLAGEYLPVERRAGGIAFASAASFAGMLFALVLGPSIGGHGHVGRLLAVEAALGVPAALALAWALRRPGPAGDDEESAAIEGGTARALWALPEMRTMCGLVFVGFGVFVALTTWLQTLLHPDGVSEQAAGALLVGMLVAGMIGSAVLPAPLARRGAERAFMRVAILVTAAGCVALAAIPSLGARAVVLAAMGFVLLPALPVIISLAERLAGRAAGTAGAIVWMSGNLGGLVLALIVQGLVHDAVAAFAAMAAAILLGLPFASRFPSTTSLARSAAPMPR